MKVVNKYTEKKTKIKTINILMKLCRSQMLSFRAMSPDEKVFSFMCIFLTSKPAVKEYNDGQTGVERSTVSLMRSRKSTSRLSTPLLFEHPFL